jgi:hypothetical protein
MIFRHYRNWIRGLQTGAGAKIGATLSSVIGASDRQKVSLKVSLSNFLGTEPNKLKHLRWWRRGELNPRPKTAERWPLHAYSAI